MPLSDYKIMSKLGQGAQGTAYQALHTTKNIIYAIKKIDVSFLTEEEKQAALLEVRIQSTLKGYPNPYIMGYVESFVDPDEAQLCLVLQWSSQGTLQDRYDESKLANKKKLGHQVATGVPFLTETELWRVFLSTVLGLHHLHSLGILHRDVKLGNVFLHNNSTDEERLDTTGILGASGSTEQQSQCNQRKLHTSFDRVQIGDFGVSTILSNERSKAVTMVGTPYYLSPELCMGKPYSSKTDIWSLGVLLYAMLFQKMPFEASNYGALILKIVQQNDISTMAAMDATKPTGSSFAPTSDLNAQYLYSPILPKLCSWCLQRKDSSRPSAIDIISHPACLAKSQELGLLIPSEVLANKAVMASISRAGRMRIPPSSDVRVAVRKQMEEQQQPCRQVSRMVNNSVPSARRNTQPQTKHSILPKCSPSGHGFKSGQSTKGMPLHSAGIHSPLTPNQPRITCHRTAPPTGIRVGKSRNIKGLVCYASVDPSHPPLKLIYRNNNRLSDDVGPDKGNMKSNLTGDEYIDNEQSEGYSRVYISHRTRDREVEAVRRLPYNVDATSDSNDSDTSSEETEKGMKGAKKDTKYQNECDYTIESRFNVNEDDGKYESILSKSHPLRGSSPIEGCPHVVGMSRSLEESNLRGQGLRGASAAGGQYCGVPHGSEVLMSNSSSSLLDGYTEEVSVHDGCRVMSASTSSAPCTTGPMTVLMRMRMGREVDTECVKGQGTSEAQELYVEIPKSRDQTVNLNSNVDREVLASSSKNINALIPSIAQSSESPTIYIPWHGEDVLQEHIKDTDCYTSNDALESPSSRNGWGVNGNIIEWRILDPNEYDVGMTADSYDEHLLSPVVLTDADHNTGYSYNSDSNSMSQHLPIPVSRLIRGSGSREYGDEGVVPQWGADTTGTYEPIDVKVISLRKTPSQAKITGRNIVVSSSNNQILTNQNQDDIENISSNHCSIINSDASQSGMLLQTLDSLEDVQMLLKATYEEGESLAGTKGLFSELMEVFSGQALINSNTDGSEDSTRESLEGSSVLFESSSGAEGRKREIDDIKGYYSRGSHFSQTQTLEFLQNNGVVDPEIQRRLIYLAFQHIFLSGQRRKLTVEGSFSDLD